jgi:translation initiation factor IF-2
MVIAINKIDLPGADPMAVKQQLMQESVLVEEFGGDVQCVEISAKQGDNVDQLLEALILQAELLELNAVADGRAQGAVVEARKDIGRGAVFTVLVTRGTLRPGDAFVAGTCSGRVRALLDEHDDSVDFAGPSRPVVVLGADDVPTAGDKLNVMPSEKEAKEVAAKRRHVQREQLLHTAKKTITLEDLFDRMQDDEQVELPVIIKGDVAGSVEAISDNLLSLSNEKVAVRVIHSAVGAISENDVGLAAASGALIIGFHLRPTPQIRQAAKDQHVELRLYDIIYEVVEEVKGAMKGMLKPIEREVATGSAEVRELFRVPKIGVIAGSYVIDGIIKRNSKVRVIREQIQIYESKVSSLKRFKEDAREVKTGFECGIGVDGFQDLKVGDILELYEIVEEAAEL